MHRKFTIHALNIEILRIIHTHGSHLAPIKFRNRDEMEALSLSALGNY